MITLTIQDDTLQSAFQKSLDEILSPSNYNSPVKRELEQLLGYSGKMKGELGEQITNFLSSVMKTEEFQQQLGKAIAEEMARRAVNSMEKSK